VDDAGKDITDCEAHRRAVEKWEPPEDYSDDRDKDYNGDGQDHSKDLDANGHMTEEYAYAFPSSPPTGPPPQLSQAVIDFNQEIAEATEAHQQRHDLHHGITRESDWGLG
jgi:hypothetical protein